MTARVTIDNLFREAASLLSEHGENPEYDRALAELCTVMAGRPLEATTAIGIILRSLREQPQQAVPNPPVTTYVPIGLPPTEFTCWQDVVEDFVRQRAKSDQAIALMGTDPEMGRRGGVDTVRTFDNILRAVAEYRAEAGTAHSDVSYFDSFESEVQAQKVLVGKKVFGL